MNIIPIICSIPLILYFTLLTYYFLGCIPVGKVKSGDKLFIWNIELQAFNIIELTLEAKYFVDRDTFFYDTIISGFTFYNKGISLLPNNYNKLVSDFYRYDGVKYHILITKNKRKFFKYLKKYV